MAEKSKAPSNSLRRQNLFPLPNGEGQGEEKPAGEDSKPARNLVQISRILRKRDTWAERLLRSWLRDRRFAGYKFRRQHQFGPHILDFFCLKAWLDIELDGSQHGIPDQKQRDAERDAWLEARGIKVLRFWNSRLRREKDAIRDTIWRTLQERAPLPLPGYCTNALADLNIGHAVPPHPGPLPTGEGESSAAARAISALLHLQP